MAPLSCLKDFASTSFENEPKAPVVTRLGLLLLARRSLSGKAAFADQKGSIPVRRAINRDYGK